MADFYAGGTRIIHTKEAQERAVRLEKKQAGHDVLKVREQGWNSGTSATRPRTPPQDKRTNLPGTVKSFLFVWHVIWCSWVGQSTNSRL